MTYNLFHYVCKYDAIEYKVRSEHGGEKENSLGYI